MKAAYFNITDEVYPGFEQKTDIEDINLRRYLAAVIVDDVEDFLEKYSAILKKVKGIILTKGSISYSEKISESIRIFYFTSGMRESLFSITKLHIEMLEENLKHKSDYELLRIDTERTMVQYKRLQGFYESVQEKARLDIQYQNKWTIDALLKLINFRNTDLLQSDLAGFPETILSFFKDNFFDFACVALIKNYNAVPEIVASYGRLCEGVFDKISSESEPGWISVFPLSFDDRYEHLLIASKDKNYYFREYEKSFFLLFSEIVGAAYKEKQNEHALIIARDEAESGNRMKSQFMANMNHELRNPLNGIIGMIGLLKSSGLDSFQLQQVSLLEFSTQSLIRIINDLLDFSSIEKGNFRLSREVFSPEALLEKTITLFEIPAVSKGLKLFFKNNSGYAHQVEGDPNRLQQIIINFITNAIKYSKHGDIIVQIDTEGENDSEIIYRFSVADNGIGIPGEKLETIFTEFVQLEDTYSKSQQGLGLGLAIVKSLTHMMNGRIELKSIYGEGSTFSVIVPFRKISNFKETSTADYYPVKKTGRKLRILLAEDDVINLFFLETAFINMGHFTEKAANGIEVLEMLENKEYDIIFMDIGMPVMNGIDCIAEIRNRNIKTTAVAISGYTSEKDINSFISSGFNQVLSKPVEIDTLAAIINAAATS